MELLSTSKFPGESDAYREARNELLQAELELRGKIEEVAALRRKLPPGGLIKEDYTFQSMVKGDVVSVRLSELFAYGKDSLVIYSYMFAPGAEQPCPMCTSMLDGLNAQALHISQRTNIYAVAKSPIEKLASYVKKRGWSNLAFLSSNDNTYNADYLGENEEGSQMPMCNVFVKTDQGIRHFYGTEVLYTPVDGQPRHVDLIWPLWNVLDLTPEGRGNDWMPKLSYQD
ncbi:MAG: DUF899 family protein [Cyclobacteriaceae bacterium]